MRKLEISQLVPGMVVAENVMTFRNDLLYPAGYRLTDKAITKLAFYSIPFICVEDESDHFSYEEMKTYSERVRSTPEFQQFAEEFEKDVYKFKNVLNAVVEKNAPLDINDLLQDTLALLHNSTQNVHIFEMINNMRQYDDSTYAHSINVALIANVLATWLGMKENDILLLTQCGLLHDIGKQLVPIDIITKKGRLTDAEMAVVREHPTYGYNMLTKEINAFSSTREIVHQHHENWDGSGYPRGLKGDDIYELAMLTHVCDVFDALISKRSYKEAFSYHTAIEILKDGSDTMFRPEMVEAFFKYVPVYHKGSQVKLTNGEEALVYKNNRGDMLEPIIKLRNGTLLDLRHSSLEIVS